MSCRRIQVRGIVQGVGFRPFVWQLAQSLKLSGSVRNGPEGVDILVVGADGALDAFATRLQSEAPPRARVDSVDSRIAADGDGDLRREGFVILDSAAGAVKTAIGPDTGVCPECLAEIRDPANRRHRYAFTTCTHCGPRYTIARSLPYDRERTSLAPFPLCHDCAIEYGDPANRRFHAESTCCPVCGPRLQLLDAHGGEMHGDPIARAATLLRAGAIVAIKGLGGFHLACDARKGAAVAELRRRKHREEKPFALMTADLATLVSEVEIDQASRALLESAERPAVLLRKRGDGRAADDAFPGVAPGLAWLGLMLPYTPLQHLLFDALADGNSGNQASPVLVMTSANPGGEPLVIDNDEALGRLGGIADAFLLHDRAIVARCDDSVIRVARCDDSALRMAEGVPQFIRRARGYTPQSIRLPAAGPSVLAFGGGYKNTICLTRGDEAFVSAHVGDLDNAAACAFLDETVERLLALTEIEPECVACDRHPDLYASRAAAEFAAARGLPLVSVQHHHAHIASVCAEHGVTGSLLGLALDGVGFGDDGGVWGGELLRVDGGHYRRLGHLSPLPLPGGDRAAREPWRMAAAALHRLGRGEEIATRFAAEPGAATAATMLARGLNAPPTSSTGRLFDAAAGLLGVCSRQSFEGQAAMQLEGLAEAFGAAPVMADGWTLDDGVLDLSPLLASLVDEADAGRGAARFHATLAAALVDWAGQAMRREGLRTVALGGGCWLNRILSDHFSRAAADMGMTILHAQAVPPGDGGLSLGQAWAVQQTLRIS